MMKLVVLSVFIAVVATQMPGNNFMRMAMMQQMARRGGGRARLMGGMFGMMNNPAYLCRETGDNFFPIPCMNNPLVCNMISIQKYKLPNLLSCSPMGIGCCLRNYQSMMFAKSL